jgi:hypothetical protein
MWRSRAAAICVATVTDFSFLVTWLSSISFEEGLLSSAWWWRLLFTSLLSFILCFLTLPSLFVGKTGEKNWKKNFFCWAGVCV